jgi:hypothetical protein
MSEKKEIDYYETLQVSPRADRDTIERVFRHMAKRFHPDNNSTGDAERFSQVMEAYQVLSDPEARAAYDARYTDVRRQQWEIFDQASATSDVETDRRIRIGILTLLYQARRRDVSRPGVGALELESILGCPSDHMEFHVWYLKEKGWVQRLDTGLLAITVDGVERLHEEDIPWSDERHRLPGPAGTGGGQAGGPGHTQGPGPGSHDGTLG